MTRMIVDAAFAAKLPTLTEPVELCDTSGRVLGHYFPAPELSEYEPLEPQVSEEELTRRSKSDEKTYTTAEVLAHLEKL
jgi:hypothetical protein